MKKLYLFLISLLLIIPFSVYAATTPRVLTLTAKSSGTTINYEGTIEEGSHAVMCKLYNSDNQEIDLLSSAVDNKVFEGSFENVEKGKYTVACANYEGGEIKNIDVTISEETTKNTTSNPKTFDNIFMWISLLGISILGLLIVIFKLKKSKAK